MRFAKSSTLLFLLLCTLIVPGASAQSTERCFVETGRCVGGRFQAYWERNGGLPVFGFAVTAAAAEHNRDTNQTYPTQWFERNRFELHAGNAAPYDVLLGRLGDDRLRQLGVNWQTMPKADSQAAHYFAQSGHAITFEPFWQYWRSHGLELGDRGVSERESLALFGLPLTEAKQETNANGDTVLTQWFERARFEYHPTKPDPYKVLLGLLGNEIRANGGTPPPPQATELVYTALGDSLATGIFASQGYVPRYWTALEAETKAKVTLVNLGRNGWTSSDLLNAVKTNEQFRSSIAKAQIVTWNIGGNDFNRVRTIYKTRSCGGADNQDCLKGAVAAFKLNWDAIMAEILALRSRNNTLMVTMDIYNPYVAIDLGADTWADDGGRSDFEVFYPYFRAANDHIAATAAANNVPMARVAAAFNGGIGSEDPRAKGYIAADGLHPNDKGHEVIATLMRELSFAPLR